MKREDILETLDRMIGIRKAPNRFESQALVFVPYRVEATSRMISNDNRPEFAIFRGYIQGKPFLDRISIEPHEAKLLYCTISSDDNLQLSRGYNQISKVYHSASAEAFLLKRGKHEHCDRIIADLELSGPALKQQGSPYANAFPRS